VPTQREPDLHRDKLGLADDADRRALRELRIVAPVAMAIGIAAWIAGAGLVALIPAIGLIAAFVQWRAWSLRRTARREYRHSARRS
jgi:hypothetical protein